MRLTSSSPPPWDGPGRSSLVASQGVIANDTIMENSIVIGTFSAIGRM